jgi:preprotein translocase SecE subunit
MGSERKWIYLSYIGLVLLSAWVLNRVLMLAGDFLRFPNPSVMGVLPATMLVSLAAMGTAGYFFFRREKVNNFSVEVLGEMKKVAWPPRKNAYVSTFVVLVTVLIASGILGLYDWICTRLIGLVLGI